MKKSTLLVTAILSVSFICTTGIVAWHVTNAKNMELRALEIEALKGEEASLFRKKQECKKYGDEIEKDIKEDNQNSIFDLPMERFEMVFYSQKEDSCIYVTRLPKEGIGNSEWIVYNALTKSKITSFDHITQYEDYKSFVLEYSGGELRL